MELTIIFWVIHCSSFLSQQLCVESDRRTISISLSISFSSNKNKIKTIRKKASQQRHKSMEWKVWVCVYWYRVHILRSFRNESRKIIIFSFGCIYQFLLMRIICSGFTTAVQYIHNSYIAIDVPVIFLFNEFYAHRVNWMTK